METPQEKSPERQTPGLAGRTTRTTTTTTTSGGNISEGTDSVNGDDNAYFNLPSELRELRQWMAFKFGKPNKHGKRPKVPKNPVTGDNAAVDNPQTWGTFDEAVAAVTRFGLDGLGFVFTANDPYTGVDLDGCRDPSTGELTPWAGELVRWLDSYSEASVSGTGLHILVKAQLRSGGGNNGTLEMYDRGRYFVMTGEHLGGTPPTIEERQGVIDTLYAENFTHKLNGKAKQDIPKKASAKQAATLREVAEALPFIPAVEHDMWLHVGMAIHTVDSGEDGFALWVEWSKGCPEKFVLDDCHTRWRSFSPTGGITAATIFGLARDHGWKNTAAREPPAPDWNEDETPEEHEADGRQGEDGEPSSTARRDFHLTDLGNAERFVAEHGRDFLFCTPWKKWLAWDGTRWERDDRQVVRQRARATVRGMYSQAVSMVKQVKNLESDTAKKQLAKKQMQLFAHAIKSENAKRVGAMIDLAQMDLTVMPEEFDTNL
jgi:putative DNA primase/helicase